jgi:hypothetical protein
MAPICRSDAGDENGIAEEPASIDTAECVSEETARDGEMHNSDIILAWERDVRHIHHELELEFRNHFPKRP